jgi:hypothetical protein
LPMHFFFDASIFRPAASMTLRLARMCARNADAAPHRYCVRRSAMRDHRTPPLTTRCLRAMPPRLPKMPPRCQLMLPARRHSRHFRHYAAADFSLRRFHPTAQHPPHDALPPPRSAFSLLPRRCRAR